MLKSIVKNCIIFFFLLTNYLFSETLETEYTYIYGPSISQNQACEKAVIEAKKKAISTKSEFFSSESIMFCDDASSGESCKSYNTLWSSSNAIIKNFKLLEKVVGVEKKTQLSFCKVLIRANLFISKGRIDPNFDFFSKLNKNIFVSGDKLKIKVDTKIPLYLNIFQWQLSDNNIFDAKVEKIFPNNYDEDNFFKNKSIIPTDNKLKNYNFITSFDNTNNNHDKKIEYILILGTKNNINFRNEYLLSELKSKINEIDLGKRRERTHIYKILMR